MSRFNQAKEYLGNINRSVFLAVGLVVAAGLIAATFIYGETKDVANQTNNDSSSQENVAHNHNEDESGAKTKQEDAKDDSSSATASEDTSMPTELADTGPESTMIGAFLLGSTVYIYRRSNKQMQQVPTR